MHRSTATLAALLAALALPAIASADTLRVSVGDDEAPSPLAAGPPAVSGDGLHVAFTSRARLTAVDPRGRVQVYVRDVSTGRTVMASARAGVAGDGDVVEDPTRAAYALSADGRFVVFAAEATNLAADTNGPARDVFRTDLATGAVTLVSRAPDGSQAAASVAGQPDMSADGRRVAFATGAALGLSAGDTGAGSDVVVRDLATGTSTLASVRTDGAPAADASLPAISADGTAVAFVTAANGVVPGDANGAADVFVRNLSASTTVLASAGAGGAAAGGTSPDLSGTGRFVAFQSAAAIAAAADGNLVADVYLRDLAAGTTTLASAVNGLQTAPTAASQGASVSADGRRVAFTSTAPDIAPGDTNGAAADVYVRDPAAGTTRRISVGATGQQVAGQRAAGPAAISPNGAAVAFAYDDAIPSVPLLPGDGNQAPDAFLSRIAAIDANGPLVDLAAPAEGAVLTARLITASGAVADPSGIASVVVAGRRARVAADGSFSLPVRVPVGPSVLVVEATDGAGNVTRIERALGRSSAGGPALPGVSRVSGLRLRVKGLRMTVVFLLSDRARVRAELFARLPAAEGRPRIQFQRRGRATIRNLLPGARGMPIVLPRKLAPGRYHVRVTAVSPGGVSAVTAPFVVEKP